MISSLRRQQRAAIAPVQELIVSLGHRTFVARGIGGHEDLDNPLDLLNARVDPRRAGLPALTVDPEPGLAVVQAADDQVDVGKDAQTDLGDQVAVEREDGELGVEARRARALRFGRHLGLAAVGIAKQHRA